MMNKVFEVPIVSHKDLESLLLLIKCLIGSVGNSLSISFWFDLWLIIGTLKTLFIISPFQHSDQTLTFADMISGPYFIWNPQLISFELPNNIKKLFATPIPYFPSSLDSLIWNSF